MKFYLFKISYMHKLFVVVHGYLFIPLQLKQFALLSTQVEH